MASKLLKWILFNEIRMAVEIKWMRTKQKYIDNQVST